ncbi:GIN domain-containing protein [Hymenobacter cavernae]|uniref:Putative auto-transporter adhesin head GIN domain-containing protein n=1 Tax=Hymenobacter cavernae TaxID=2044852 RepID=A0ABQ1U922_9BACT|nr:DUF2807 domain-containing protein [Hymenobacter cavernae]GGF13604.1 hypothetical protein GCM10011383_26050 [Hymenobacter cavernae]
MFWSRVWPQVSGRQPLLRGIVGLAAFLPLLTGCGDGHETDCLKSTGKVVTERRNLAPFHIVTAYDNVDVLLVQDTATYAEVRAGKNLQEDIELTVQNGQLTIHNTSRCNWVRTYNTPRELTLHLPRLTDLFLRGQGNVRTLSNFRADTVFCHLVGAGDFNLDLTSNYIGFDTYELGDVELHGRTNELHYTLGGSGSFRAGGFQTRDFYFQSNVGSTGDAHIAVSRLLAGNHAGTGTLYYSGNPTILNLTSKGKVVKVN